MYHGAVVVPLDPSAPVEALANFLENSESKLTFVSPTNLESWRGLRAAGPAHQRRQAATRERLDGFCLIWLNGSQTPRPPEFDLCAPAC